MELSEFLKKRRQRQEVKLKRVVNYLNNYSTRYQQCCDKLQKEDDSVRKFLSLKYQLMTNTYVFDKLNEYKQTHKNATTYELVQLEKDCLRSLDADYEELKEQTKNNFLQKNSDLIGFVKTYEHKLQQYEIMQLDLNIRIPLKAQASLQDAPSAQELI